MPDLGREANRENRGRDILRLTCASPELDLDALGERALVERLADMTDAEITDLFSKYLVRADESTAFRPSGRIRVVRGNNGAPLGTRAISSTLERGERGDQSRWRCSDRGRRKFTRGTAASTAQQLIAKASRRVHGASPSKLVSRLHSSRTLRSLVFCMTAARHILPLSVFFMAATSWRRSAGHRSPRVRSCRDRVWSGSKHVGALAFSKADGTRWPR